MEKLKKRWGVTSNFQLIVIFIVFAITGSSAAFAAKPITNFLGINYDNSGWLYYLVKFVLIFPLYQVLLVLLGFIFGQFDFFWNFEKKMLHRLKLGKLIEVLERKK
jgi:hypothetical protein